MCWARLKLQYIENQRGLKVISEIRSSFKLVTYTFMERDIFLTQIRNQNQDLTNSMMKKLKYTSALELHNLPTETKDEKNTKSKLLKVNIESRKWLKKYQMHQQLEE